MDEVDDGAMIKLQRLIAELPRIRSEKVKSPRDYASDIMKLKTREERVKALHDVPDEYRALVKTHVVNFFERKKGLIT